MLHQNLNGQGIFPVCNNSNNNISYYRAATIAVAQVLVIDEISMISEKTLNMVDHVCQEVRGQNIPMGGLQSIFVGDFKVFTLYTFKDRVRHSRIN